MIYLTLTDRIDEFLAGHKSEIIQDLKNLIQIPSVKEAAVPGAPNGVPCAMALNASAKLFQRMSMKTKIFENSGYALAEFGQGDKTIGLFSHCDVVPAGGGWIYTDPFVPIEKNGFIVGRGAEDNKSGVIASVYAVKAIQELGLSLNSKLAVFVGSDEESGMGDADAFVREQNMPDVSIVPDNSFPVYVGEKGTMRFFAQCGDLFQQVRSVSGGSAFNVVLDEVSVTITQTDALQKELTERAEQNERIQIKQSGNDLILTAMGVSKHASAPEGSENALFCAANFLKSCSELPEADRNIFSSVAELLKGFYGEPFGIEHQDKNFGRLTCANGIAKMDNGRLALSFDIRYGTEADGKFIIDEINRVLTSKSWSMTELENRAGFNNDAEKEVVNALLSAYQTASGDNGAKPHYSAGATYAAHLKNAFSVGTCAPYKFKVSETLPQGHGGIHQKDEMLHVEGFLEGIKILVLMILNADKAIHK